MICCRQESPRQANDAPESSPDQRAVSLLEAHAIEWTRGLGPDPTVLERREALMTGLMDLYRRTGSETAFDQLAGHATGRLLRRVKARTRHLGDRVDPHEIVQDALVNICRYPAKFDASRPNAFRVWSSTIVDNAVRRHLRKPASAPEVRLQPVEILTQRADVTERSPEDSAVQRERVQELARAYGVVLQVYLAAYRSLSERERFVLHMVEVHGMRYAVLAERVGIRPEALKMVVFRARRRIMERMTKRFDDLRVPSAD